MSGVEEPSLRDLLRAVAWLEGFMCVAVLLLALIYTLLCEVVSAFM